MSDWPHAPTHRLDERGVYMVTAGTYRKAPLFDGRERLRFLRDTLLDIAAECGWSLHAWAVLANHYHFIAGSPPDASSLRSLIRRLHSLTGRWVNDLDKTPGRRVWHQFWDSQITFQRSYLARLKYVNENPVRHGVAREASSYPFCSAGWFERTAPVSFQETVRRFRTDRLKVVDDF